MAPISRDAGCHEGDRPPAEAPPTEASGVGERHVRPAGAEVVPRQPGLDERRRWCPSTDVARS